MVTQEKRSWPQGSDAGILSWEMPNQEPWPQHWAPEDPMASGRWMKDCGRAGKCQGRPWTHSVVWCCYWTHPGSQLTLKSRPASSINNLPGTGSLPPPTISKPAHFSVFKWMFLETQDRLWAWVKKQLMSFQRRNEWNHQATTRRGYMKKHAKWICFIYICSKISFLTQGCRNEMFLDDMCHLPHLKLALLLDGEE